jgi:hypothetical protein
VKEPEFGEPIVEMVEHLEASSFVEGRFFSKAPNEVPSSAKIRDHSCWWNATNDGDVR